MIVVATQIDPPHSWRKPGTTFAVQEVYAGGDRPVSLRIEAPDGNPALVDAEHFDVVDGAVSSGWEFQQGAHGTYTVGPKAWGKLGFWERWMNRDPDALASYEQFRTILVDPNLAWAVERVVELLGESDWDVRQLELSRASYVWEPARGGRAVIVGGDGSVLLASSGTPPEEHEADFFRGSRTPAEQFNSPGPTI